MKTLVLVNRNADSGRAVRKWRRIAPWVRDRFGASLSVWHERADWEQLVGDALGSGPAIVVAAGGDGTVHRVANLMLALPPDQTADARLGAIGLGSGNDFHKPLNGCVRVQGVPVRCCASKAVRQNVIRVEWEDAQGGRHRAHAVTSCSLGMIALGNELFSRRRGPVGLCRRFSHAAGVWCAAVLSTAARRAVRARVYVAGEIAYDGAASLVSAYVNPHFAAGLSYTGPMDVVRPGMGITVLPDVGVLERWRLLREAAQAELPGPPRTRHWEAQHCEIKLDEAQLLEMDGEVVAVKGVRMRLVPGALEVCR